MTRKVTKLSAIKGGRDNGPDCDIKRILCGTCGSGMMAFHQCMTHGDIFASCANCETVFDYLRIEDTAGRLDDGRGPKGAA